MGRGVRVRGRVAVRERIVPWWAWMLVAAGAVAGMPSWGQGSVAPAAPNAAVPEVVRPQGEGATIPPGNDGGVPRPRSENPLAGDVVRPVPDNGVIAPPVTGGGAVIRPPVAGVTPIIPPPGSSGGASGVVPK